MLAITIFGTSLDGSMEVRWGNSSFDLRYSELDGIPFTTSDELAKIADNRFYSAVKRKESLSIGGDSYTFSPNNRFVVVAERTYDMEIPTSVAVNALFIPLYPILDIMADRAGMSIDLEGDRAVFIDGKRPQVQPETATTKVDSKPEESVSPESEVAEVPFVPVIEDEGEAIAPKRKKKWLVAVDPGHGGKDPGASSKDGTREKTLVLDISKKLCEALEKDTLFTVIITRNDDTFLPLKQRTGFANTNGADLFVSIHCNAAKNKSARGTQVFFLAPARSDQARATAALENSSIFLEEPTDSTDDLDFIMADLIQNEFLRESSRLAVLIEESISSRTGLSQRGPAGAGFYVLKGSFMPAVLIESAFMSNVDDAALLKKESFRKKIAEGIVDGLRVFIDELPE